MYLFNLVSSSITGNNIHDSTGSATADIRIFEGNNSLTIKSNTIRNGAGRGVRINNIGTGAGNSANITLNFNRIVSNAVAGLDVDAAGYTGTLNAENNWWGCNYGPGAGGAGCSGTANGANGSVGTNPWLTLTFTASPASVPIGGTSALTSKLVTNSDNVDTVPMSMFVPGSTPVSFAGTLGTVAPMSATLTSGVAASIYTGVTPGAGSGSTTIDQQTLSQGIAVQCPAITLAPMTLPNGTINTAYSGATITASGGASSYNFTVTGGALPMGMSLSLGGVLAGTPTQSGFFQFVVTATDANNCTGTRMYGLQISSTATSANCSTVVRPSPLNGWGPANVRTDATVGITTDQPRSGAGSLKFTTNTITSGQDKADFVKTWGVVAGRTLGNLNALSYEFYRAASSTTAAHFAPAVRLVYQTPGGDTAYLIWEPIYNGYSPSVPTNQWVSPNLITGNFWMRAFGPSRTIDLYNITLADWTSGVQLTDGDGQMSHVLGPNTNIVGIEVGVGSGWGATFTGWVDNVFAAFGGNDFECANFEPNCNTLTFTPASLPSGSANSPYMATIAAASGYPPYTLSLTGTLPMGITFDSMTGLLSGTTMQTGSFPITINATDVSGCTGSIGYTLNIGCQTITVNAPVANIFPSSSPFSVNFTQAGAIGSATFTLNSGTLPMGVTLSPAGVLSGTAAQTSPFPITVKVTDSNGCIGISGTYNQTITCGGITINPPSLPNGVAGSSYSQQLTTTGSNGSLTFSLIGSLPAGLTLSASGLISGTPTAGATTSSFTVQVVDGNGCTGTANYTLLISCPTIALSPAALPNATINTAYPQTISASPAGGNYTFAVTSGLLPAGLTLNSNGSFGGAPTQSGVFNFRITATGFGSCTAFRDYVLLVECPGLTVNPSSLPGGTVGSSYSQTVSALPAGTYSHTVTSGALPTGLSLNASTGAITGTPTTGGSFTLPSRQRRAVVLVRALTR